MVVIMRKVALKVAYIGTDFHGFQSSGMQTFSGNHNSDLQEMKEIHILGYQRLEFQFLIPELQIVRTINQISRSKIQILQFYDQIFQQTDQILQESKLKDQIL